MVRYTQGAYSVCRSSLADGGDRSPRIITHDQAQGGELGITEVYFRCLAIRIVFERRQTDFDLG